MVSCERGPAEPRSMQLRSRRRSDRYRRHAIFATHNGVREPAPRRKPTLPLCPSILGAFRDARRTRATSDMLLNGAYDFATDNIFMDTPLTEAAAGWMDSVIRLAWLSDSVSLFACEASARAEFRFGCALSSTWSSGFQRLAITSSSYLDVPSPFSCSRTASPLQH